ncbi:uncharacterized protein LOC112270947 [Brachypodium distachyon]|uniref:uncharacterized protein LOC112270947 n=1 Tax=Brachypodium distachyon TaxID=15368 RepID=UPI000D0DD7C7|nr:uncharacterized protein LOC112270947 [Brachypodium distachyon]|eukprot:XP_024315490.1 uncharacterized protein LOC112270947 [Brachypodium distachyon]
MDQACRIAAVCRRWRAVLSKPTFLSHRHLSQLLRPPPPLAAHHRPYALVIQPLQKVGRFTHLTLVALDPGAGRVPVKVPLQPKYVDPPPPPPHKTTAKPNPDYVRAKPQAPPDLAAAADPAPWEVFFERTVPELDISIAASHGRLFLCRGRSRYYVCDPAANRWAELPPSAVAPHQLRPTLRRINRRR